MRTESKRQKQVSEIIKRNFGHILLEQGSYIYEDALVTVTNVKTSPDFGQAKIYVSVYNTEEKQLVVDKLQHQNHMLRNELGRRIRKHVRKIPTIHIYLDETLDEMYRLDNLFKQIHQSDAAVRGSEEE